MKYYDKISLRINSYLQDDKNSLIIFLGDKYSGKTELLSYLYNKDINEFKFHISFNQQNNEISIVKMCFFKILTKICVNNSKQFFSFIMENNFNKKFDIIKSKYLIKKIIKNEKQQCKKDKTYSYVSSTEEKVLIQLIKLLDQCSLVDLNLIISMCIPQNMKAINIYVGCYNMLLQEDIEYLNQMENVITINLIVTIRPCYKQNNDYLQLFANDYFNFEIIKIESDNNINLMNEEKIVLPVYSKYIKDKNFEPSCIDYDYVYNSMLKDNYFTLLESDIGYIEENKSNLLLLSIILSIGYLRKEQIEIICKVVNLKNNLSINELRNRYKYIWEIKDEVYSGSLWGDFVVYKRLNKGLKEQLDIFFCKLLFKIFENQEISNILNISKLRLFIHEDYNFLLNSQYSEIFKLLIEFIISYKKHQMILLKNNSNVCFIDYLNNYKLSICNESLRVVKNLTSETQDLSILYTYLHELKEKLNDIDDIKELNKKTICDFVEFSWSIAYKWLDISIMEETFIIWDRLLKHGIVEQNDISDFILDNESNMSRGTIVSIIKKNSLNELKYHIIGGIDMKIDVLIVIATQEEEQAIVKNDNWEICHASDFTYYCLYKNGLGFALVRGYEYGKTAAAIISEHSIKELKPRAIAMAGFAAGNERNVQLGDIIVPYQVFDYDGGKQISENECLKEITSFRIDNKWKQIIERFGEEWRESITVQRPKKLEQQYHELLQEFGDKQILKTDDIYNKTKYPDWVNVLEYLNENKYIEFCPNKQIKITEEGSKFINLFDMQHPEGYKVIEPKTKIGVLATGSKVQQWSNIFKLLEQYDRKTCALDMEASAIANIANFNGLPFIIAKGIGDFATESKSFDNRFIEYACHSSCRFLIEFFTSEEVNF
ncbi:MAG: Nucleoside phosphorylase-like [Haloplasmataceae bacterium]|jgi:nucleoside phosphorylase|nr:Nucleoside phosphorylase-like [Haloplasmataceae bacterium]